MPRGEVRAGARRWAGYWVRLVAAVAVSLWGVLLVATMVLRAVRGGAGSDGLRFFATSLLVLVLVLVAPRLWRSAEAHRPVRAAADLTSGTEPEPRPHRVLSAPDAPPPPRRW